MDSKHSQQIARIVAEYGAKTGKFRKAVLAALADDLTCDADREHMTSALNLIPDAWDIEPEVRTITIFEVEDSNPVRKTQMAKIVSLMWALDYYEWALRLIAVDIWNSERLINPLEGWQLLSLRDKHYGEPERLSPEDKEWVEAIKALPQ